MLPLDGRADLLLLASVCRAIPRAALSAWLDALAFPAAERDVVVATATGAADAAARLRQAARPSEIAAVLADRPLELAALASALGGDADDGGDGEDDTLGVDPARRWIAELRHVALAIDGADLLAAGVPQGEALGRGLAAALRAKLDGEAVGRDAELAVALASAR